MPYVSWLSLVIIAAVAAIWGTIGLSVYRRKQLRRQREHEWTQFAREHRELDHDLDKVWYRT
jgi:C4-dicarboxylate-specific signal transduction histidine kinase